MGTATRAHVVLKDVYIQGVLLSFSVFQHGLLWAASQRSRYPVR